MRPVNIELGKKGEEIACGYLVDKGYKILGQNFWRPFGEIDIITKFQSQTLVFVEVKTIHKPGQAIFPNLYQNSAKSGQILAKPNKEQKYYIEPEDNLTAAKLAKLRKICEWHVSCHPSLVDQRYGWRIDLLALTIYDKNCLIRHYENI